MKRLLAALCVCVSVQCSAQNIDFLSVPPDTITVRLNIASVEMRKAAWSRNTSIWVGVFGGIFTILAADQSAKAYSQPLAVSFGCATAGGFAVLQLKGANHDRRAAKAFHFNTGIAGLK